MTVTLSGSGIVRASGTTGRVDVTVSGSGVADLGKLAARDVRAVVSGSGQIVVWAERSLDAAVPGSGTIGYSGDPATVTTRVTGSGAIDRR